MIKPNVGVAEIFLSSQEQDFLYRLRSLLRHFLKDIYDPLFHYLFTDRILNIFLY